MSPMRAGRPGSLAATTAALTVLGLPGAALARHPASEPTGPWLIVSVLVLALAFALVWGIWAYVERRQKPPASETDPGRGR
jgi:membrane protein implicated in regulation of membrane protease activity